MNDIDKFKFILNYLSNGLDESTITDPLQKKLIKQSNNLRSLNSFNVTLHGLRFVELALLDTITKIIEFILIKIISDYTISRYKSSLSRDEIDSALNYIGKIVKRYDAELLLEYPHRHCEQLIHKLADNLNIPIPDLITRPSKKFNIACIRSKSIIDDRFDSGSDTDSDNLITSRTHSRYAEMRAYKHIISSDPNKVRSRPNERIFNGGKLIADLKTHDLKNTFDNLMLIFTNKYNTYKLFDKCRDLITSVIGNDIDKFNQIIQKQLAFLKHDNFLQLEVDGIELGKTGMLYFIEQKATINPEHCRESILNNFIRKTIATALFIHLCQTPEIKKNLKSSSNGSDKISSIILNRFQIHASNFTGLKWQLSNGDSSIDEQINILLNETIELLPIEIRMHGNGVSFYSVCSTTYSVAEADEVIRRTIMP